MKKNLRLTTHSLVWMASAALLVASCSRDIAQRTHLGEIPLDEVVYAPKGEPANAEEFNKLDPSSLSTRLGGPNVALSKTNVSEAEAILTELEPVMTTGRYIEDPRYAATSKMRQTLLTWNRALLGLIYTKPEAAQAWLEKYAIVILSGCNEDLQGCLNIGFFRQDAGTARIMEELARRQDKLISAAHEAPAKNEAVRRYYKYLLVAFDLRNKVSDPQFEFLYLNRAGEYAAFHREAIKAADDAYKASKDADQAGKANEASRLRQALRRHSEVFEMLLNGFQPNMQDASLKARVEQFVSNFKPWSYSRREENPFGVGATKILSLASSNFMYTSGQQGSQLSPSLRQAIDESQKADGSFEKLMQMLNTSEQQLVKNLDLRSDFPRDEYFFIIDRLFNDHLTPDDASAIWQNTRRDAPRLLKTLEQYLKVQVAGMIVKTNSYMGQEYAKRDGYTGNSLLRHAVESSFPISNEWTAVVAKIQRINVFVNRHMRNANSNVQSEEFNRVDKILTSLGNNIKFVSVYPNMMLMIYFMEMVDGKLTIYTFWGPIELDTKIVIEAFLNGHLPPFFKFGNDNGSLKKLEILYAFNFALKTETFKTFKQGGNDDLDEAKFFEKVIGKYLAEEQTGLTRLANDITDDFNHSPTHSTYMQLCRQDKALRAAGKSAGSEGITLPLSLEQFMSSTYMGSTDSYGKTALQFYGDPLYTQMSEFNQSLRTKLTFVESMIQIYAEHLESTGENDAQRKEKIDKIRANVAKVTDAQTQALSEIVRRHKEISECVTQTAQIEWDRQHLLIKKEEAHLRDAWRRMQKARGASAPQAAQDGSAAASTAAAGSLENLFKDYSPVLPGDNFPSGFVSDGSITPEEYNYSQLDVVLRMRRYLKEIAPRTEVRLPGDLTLEKIWQSPSRVTLSGNLPEDQFVAQGLLLLNGVGGSTFVKWVPSTNELVPFVVRLKVLAELYKLGEFEIYDRTNANCHEGGNRAECPRSKMKVTAEQVLDEASSMIRTISLTEGGRPKREAETMRLLSLATRFKKDDLKRLFLDAREQQRTLFEEIFKIIADDPSAENEAREYFNTSVAEGHFLYPVSLKFKTLMRRNYRPLLMNAYKSADTFFEAIKTREKADEKNPLELGYELRDGYVVSIRPQVISGVPVYLNRHKAGDFETRKSLFHRDTWGRFNPCPVDDDYQSGGATAHCGELKVKPGAGN